MYTPYGVVPKDVESRSQPALSFSEVDYQRMRAYLDDLHRHWGMSNRDYLERLETIIAWWNARYLD